MTWIYSSYGGERFCRAECEICGKRSAAIRESLLDEFRRNGRVDESHVCNECREWGFR